MDQIVARADVSKGTFFNYFTRKADVLKSVLARRARAAAAAADEILSLAIPVRDQLQMLLSEAARQWEEDREWSRHVLGAMTGPGLRAAVEASEYRDMVRNCIERGQKSGEFREALDPARAEALISAMFHDTLSRWGERPDSDLQSELREQLAMLLEGLEA